MGLSNEQPTCPSGVREPCCYCTREKCCFCGGMRPTAEPEFDDDGSEENA